MTLSENGAVATKNVYDDIPRAAASKVVMQSGRHFAQFTMVGEGNILFGVIRPGWDVEEGEGAYVVDGHCFYATYDPDDGPAGWPGNITWQGMQASKQGDRIGMLLDLDQGSMTVYKGDEKLGVMQTEGPSGPFCWAVELWNEDSSTRIASGPAPASPTDEELAAAKVWQRRERLYLPQTATDAECAAAEATEATEAAAAAAEVVEQGDDD